MSDTTTSYTAGDRVRIVHSGQVDHGVVVTATHDEDGNRITTRRVAVEVENGQGVWGFLPSSLTQLGGTR